MLSDEELDRYLLAEDDSLWDAREAIVAQAREANRLRAVLQAEIDAAPSEEPERYDGDNHGDSEANACERSAWYKAQKWKKVLGIHD